MWQQGVDTLAKVFSYNIAEMIRRFQDYLYSPGRFDFGKNLCSNYLQFSSVPGQQLDTRSFTYLLKRIEAFPSTECACERLFVNYVI
jgi:hypothetical protein